MQAGAGRGRWEGGGCSRRSALSCPSAATPTRAPTPCAGLALTCTPEQKCAPGFNGDVVLTQMGFDGLGSIAQNCGILIAILGVSICLAYAALWFNVRKLVRS